MPLVHAYCVANAFAGLPESSIVPSAGSSTNRGRMVDGRVDRQWDTGVIGASWTLTVVFDYGSAISLVGIAALNHNGTDALPITMRVRAADDAAISVGVVTPWAAVNMRATNAVAAFSATSKRYWEVRWVSGVTPTSFKIGELFAMATATQLSRHVVYGSGGEQLFKTNFAESPTGRLMGGKLSGPLKARHLVWEDLSAANLLELETMHAAANGNGRDLFWVEHWDPAGTSGLTADQRQECYYGRFLEDRLRHAVTDYDLYGGVQLTLREQTRGVGA